MSICFVVDGRPETLGLKQIIKHHIDFQFELATRKYTTLLNKELDNKEIKEGLIRACNIIDLIIEILRGSKNLKMAKDCLLQETQKELISSRSVQERMHLSFILLRSRHLLYWSCAFISLSVLR